MYDVSFTPMRRLLLHFLCTFPFLLTLQACIDQPITPAPQPGQFRLKRTITTSAIRANTKDTVIVTYTYNQQGNLELEDYVHTNTSDPQLQLGYRSAFTYNAQNQLVRIDTRITNNKTYLPNRYATRLDYTHDSDGRVKTETHSTSTLTDMNPTDPYQINKVSTFTYTGSRFPATVTRTDGTTTTYAYDKENLVLSGYTYDDKPNPYYGIIRGDGFNPRLTSANNAVRVYPSDSKYRQVMTYNAAGLLTRLAIIYTNPDDPVYNYGSQYAFEYEAY